MTPYQILKGLLSPCSYDDGRLLDADQEAEYREQVFESAKGIEDLDALEITRIGAMAQHLSRMGFTAQEVIDAARRLLQQDASLAPQLELIQKLVA